MTYYAFGDSITTGAGASNPSTKGYIALLNAALGTTFTNYAVSTAMAMDLDAQLYATNTGPGDVSTVFFGTNDQAKYDTVVAKRTYFIDAARAYAVWLGTDGKKATPANGVWFRSGDGWSASYANGCYGSGVPNAMCQVAVTGDKIALGFVRQKNNTSTFRVTIDGVVKGVFSSGGDVTTMLPAGSPKSYGPMCLIFTGLGNKEHLVQIDVVQGDASNVVMFQFFSGMAPQGKVILGNIPHAVAYTYGGSNANVDAYNTAIAALVTELAGYGLDVALADVCSVMTTADFADNVHPNDAGHVKYWDVVLAALQATPIPIVYTPADIYFGSDGKLYGGILGNLKQIATVP